MVNRAEYQHDQSEQRAKHDHRAHVRTPFDTHSTFRIVHTILNSVPQRSAARQSTAEVPTAPTAAMRRPRGEPRRLLLDAARTLFARQDYRSTTTREIAADAGVTEHLLFRHFGSKAALFREALVLPFTSFVDEFGRTWQSVIPEETDEQELAGHFVGQLYDVFVRHQGLLLTLMASEALTEEELADTGIADVRRALRVLGRISAEGMNLRGMRSDHPDLPAHSTVAMIAGMAALRSTYFGTKPPSREVIVDELIQAILHGFLHRND
jgi:AcrR family transcriptional regulator